MSVFSLSGAFCLHNRVCIMEQTEDSVLVGMVHAENAVLMDKLTAAYSSETGGKGVIRFMPVTEEECLRHITGFIADGAEVAEEVSAYCTEKDDVDAVSPSVNLLDNIVLEAVFRNASDIHLEPYAEPGSDVTRLCVRFRTAGVLEFYRMYEGEVVRQLVRRIKVLAELNAEETRLCQDGRFVWQSAGKTAPALKRDIRVSCIPVWNGESVVMRLLRTMEDPPELAELGFSSVQQQVLSRILKMKSRLVIVSGPTGAGKTTTLAALLSVLAGEGKKIVTLEDPVEYRIPGVSQVEVHEEGGLGFQEVLKRVFRHDPDVLMIGEIRDEQSARTAVRAALTGHLVFATMHASNACAAVVRLQDLGIPPYLVSSVFGAVIAQQLFPCPEQQTGRFAGRMLGAEILEGSYDVTECISRECNEDAVASTMLAEGMQRIESDIATKRLLLNAENGTKQEKKLIGREVSS